MYFGSNKRAVETFLVSLPLQTTMPTTGTLVNTTLGSINLNNGQLGIVNPGYVGTTLKNNFVDATPTLAEAAAIQLYQGTAQSATMSSAKPKSPLAVRPYEASPIINGKSRSIRFTKQAFVLGNHQINQIGDVDASANRIIAADNTTYQVHIKYTGVRAQELFCSNGAALRAYYTSPNFTVLGYTAVQSRSAIVTSLAVELNSNSNVISGIGGISKGGDPIVALALGEATATGATAIAGLTLNAVVPVAVIGGVTRSIQITAELLASLQAAAVASPALTHILVANKADIGVFTAGLAKALWIIGMDEEVAFTDYVAQTKAVFETETPEGFASNVTDRRLVFANEGQGYGRVLNLLYAATAGQRKYAGRHDMNPVIEYPSPVVEDTKYVVYNGTFENEMQIDSANISVSPHRVIVLIPAETTPAVVNPLIATFDSTLNSWLGSNGHSAITTI
jgi:hypothetical protein